MAARDSEYDADLRSVQEARRLAVACREAQREFAHASQAEVDRVCAAMARRSTTGASCTCCACTRRIASRP